MVSHIRVQRPAYPTLFGGLGFNNIESGMYALMDPEYFSRYVQKCNRELAPGFCRSWGGFAEWTREDMDQYYEYYSRMQAETDTMMYLVPGRARSHETPEERRQWAADVADRLAYLYHEKGMKHLQYYCMSNEQSLETWGTMIHQMDVMKEYHTYLFREFQRRKLPVGLMAPDVSEPRNYNTLFWSMSSMQSISAAYTAHLYLHDSFDAEDLGMYKWLCRLMSQCAGAATNQEKPFILSEYGWGTFRAGGGYTLANGDTPSYQTEKTLGGTVDHPRYAGTDKEAYSLLSIAEMNLACINAGVFATGYWTFVDYPDPQLSSYRSDEWGKKWAQARPFLGWGTDMRYNQCGVLRWNDFENPTADSYWCLGIMTRFLKKDTHVLFHRTDDDLLRAAVLQDRQGHVSVCVVNRHAGAQKIQLEMGGLIDRPMRMYVYDPAHIRKNPFADLQPYTMLCEADAKGNVKAELAGSSVTILTTDYENRTPPAAGHVRREGDKLVWDAVTEPEHRYYRVFRNGEQIASTVQESLPVGAAEGDYKVFSVDCWQNCAAPAKK